MIGKAKCISHGEIALEYAMGKDKAELLKVNNLLSSTPNEVYKEMKLIQDYNSRCMNKFIRIEVSPHPKDGNKMKNEQFLDIAEKLMKKHNLQNNQYVVVKHSDTNKPHIHIIANRINYLGQAKNNSFISNKTSKYAEEIANDFGLIQANQIERKKPYLKKYRDDEEEIDFIKKKHKEALKICKSYQSYIKFLENYEIIVKPKKHKKTNQIFGHSIHYNNKDFKGSKVHRSMSYSNVIKSITGNKFRNHEITKNSTRNHTKKSI